MAFFLPQKLSFLGIQPSLKQSMLVMARKFSVNQAAEDAKPENKARCWQKEQKPFKFCVQAFRALRQKKRRKALLSTVLIGCLAAFESFAQEYGLSVPKKESPCSGLPCWRLHQRQFFQPKAKPSLGAHKKTRQYR